MAKGIQIQNGKMLFWRLGDLKFDKQNRWDRAPESRGMWAFPWPYFEMFFAYHKFTDALPKRLQTNSDGYPVKNDWFGVQTDETVWQENEWHHNGGYTIPKLAPLDAKNLPDDLWVERTLSNGETVTELGDKYEVLPEFYEEQNRWIKEVGSKNVRLRKFMVEGELYSHFNPHSGVIDALDVWHKMDVTTYAKLLRKNRGDRYWDRLEDGSFRNGGGYDVDHMEVFLDQKSCKISGGK